MPIQIPNLDDRSAADLAAELKARIAAHTPEWTNPALGDPGVTLIELFAWLADALLYRVNLVPEKQRRAFLRLLGANLRPATAARTIITVLFDDKKNRRAQLLEPHTRVKGPVPFETRTELTVLPVIAEAYCKRPLTDAEHDAMQAKLAQLSRLYATRPGTREGDAVHYITTPVFTGGRPDSAGFDLAADTVDRTLWFALLVPEEGKKSPQGQPNYADDIKQLKAVLGRSASGGPQYLNLGFSPRAATPAFAENAAPPPPVPFRCEVTTEDPAHPGFATCQQVKVEMDTTKGLRTDGVIRIRLPEEKVFFAPDNSVRALVQPDTDTTPPRLDDPDKAARVVVWLRLRPERDLYSLVISWADINAVEVDQRQTFAGLIIGQGNGQPGQQFTLPARGIEEKSFELQVEEAGLGFDRKSWRCIDDLALAQVRERVFTFDAEAGVIGFGDGVRGRIPEAGARIRIKTMRTGGGAAGNVAAGTLAEVNPKDQPVARLKASQPLTAAGGQDAETLEEAERRIPALFRNRDRAVTSEDYAQITANTPGVQIGRVETIPLFKPQQRRYNVPGVVSVMALPKRERVDAPYPRVDRPFLEAVFTHLNARKPVGTELYVIGCEYVPLALTVGIDNPEHREDVNAAVQEALKKFLYCQSPGGPQGNGWPLGRTVRRRELEIIVSRVDGVDGVYGPNLFTLEEGRWRPVTTTDNNESAAITLQRWQLPELVGVIVSEGPAAAAFKPPRPPKAATGLAIPVVPEVC